MGGSRIIIIWRLLSRLRVGGWVFGAGARAGSARGLEAGAHSSFDKLRMNVWAAGAG